MKLGSEKVGEHSLERGVGYGMENEKIRELGLFTGKYSDHNGRT